MQPEFEKREEELIDTISFYWSMKVVFTKKMILKSTQVIILYFKSVCLKKPLTLTMLKLQEEHKQKLVEHRFSTPPSETLETIINPSILKLTEENDKTRIYLLGPFFTLK